MVCGKDQTSNRSRSAKPFSTVSCDCIARGRAGVSCSSRGRARNESSSPVQGTNTITRQASAPSTTDTPPESSQRPAAVGPVVPSRLSGGHSLGLLCGEILARSIWSSELSEAGITLTAAFVGRRSRRNLSVLS